MAVAEDMATKEQVQSWIQWSRYDLPRTGDYPKINIVEINRVTCPWQEGISDLFERSDRKSQGELLTLFEDQLSRDPGDISSRLTALSLHYALSHYDSILIEDLVEEPRVDFTKNLGYFVRLLPVEECADWPTICWEISNTYAILDWDRASRLYKHLEALGLRDAVKLRVLRGQFNFLVVYDSEFDPIDWEPKIYDSTDAVQEFLIILWGLTEKDKKESNLQEADRDRIYDAANDLEKALNKRSDLSPAYQSLLAKCYFAKQDFHNAAKNYQQLLTILKNHSVFGQS